MAAQPGEARPIHGQPRWPRLFGAREDTAEFHRGGCDQK
jgi:hypothetical protein